MTANGLTILHLVVLRFWSAIAWHAVMLARALEDRGHRCFIAGVTGSPILRQAPREGLGIAPELHLDWLRPWNWLATVTRLRAFLVRQGVDVAFVHTGSGHLELHLARSRLKTALVRVRADARLPRGDPGHRWLYRRATDQVALSGRFMATAHVGGWGIEETRLVHLPPGIPLRAIATDPRLSPAAARPAVRERYGIGAAEPLLGIVGRLSPVKGHADLIRAVGLLAHEGHRFRLLIVGAEKETPVADLRHLARSLSVESRLVFTGFVEDPLVHAAAVDIGVIPSLGSEAVSRSALEFMAVGVPVVASSVGILPEVIERGDQLVPPGSPAALAAALGPLLTDPARARRRGEAGRNRVRTHYSLEVLGERGERVARAAMETRGKGYA